MSVLIAEALKNAHRPAIAASGAVYTYKDILQSVLQLTPQLPSPTDGEAHHRVAIMCNPGPEYVAATYATWLTKGIAVPLCLDHPDKELQYVLEDSQATAVVATRQHIQRIDTLARPFAAQSVLVETQGSSDDTTINTATIDTAKETDPALMVYTSGTTGKPKGVVHTHSSINAMIHTLVTAWKWTSSDRILHSLPLHHVHGIVNALYCPLAVGATVEFLPRFSPEATWKSFMRPQDKITVFMGVPTMYYFLLSHYDSKMNVQQQQQASQAATDLRLAVSGSASCPLPVLERWKQLAGKYPLERYGMTETGMILGNPLDDERQPGSVGLPFDGVAIKLGTDGELSVKSKQLMAGYWNKPEATRGAFDGDGYFKTGDTAVISPDDGYVKLLGRTSVDIIKRGGYKISALHIESALLRHPLIKECAVVGLEDAEYGEIVAAVVSLDDGLASLELKELRQWAKELLPVYQLPDRLHIVKSIPRNAMGKINKKSLKADLLKAVSSALQN